MSPISEAVGTYSTPASAQPLWTDMVNDDSKDTLFLVVEPFKSSISGSDIAERSATDIEPFRVMFHWLVYGDQEQLPMSTMCWFGYQEEEWSNW